MHSHNHDCGTCKHECLHYCTCCGKVYCCKCGQEWGYVNYWYGTPYTWQPYGVTWGLSNTISGDAAVIIANEVKEACDHNWHS